MPDGTCRICGCIGTGEPFTSWVRDTFTNYDHLFPGEIICSNCLFWFEQRSTVLQERMNKDKPQRMQNYSHFIKRGEWTPLSKSDKRAMLELLVEAPFPELAAIAESGQKHIAFRATRNPAGGAAGWVQFEEQRIWVDPGELAVLVERIEALYSAFNKTEIGTGRYAPYRIKKYGLQRWAMLEEQLKPARHTALFALALFLAQKGEADGNTGAGRQSTDGHMEGDTSRLQEPVSHDDLGAVRERGAQRGLHQQPEQVRQLDLFQDVGERRG